MVCTAAGRVIILRAAGGREGLCLGRDGCRIGIRKVAELGDI